ncbi:hypothetical protein HAX54_011579, partial [Datura stramonium]|nr:hypothetical protein [Datura stramonium]
MTPIRRDLAWAKKDDAASKVINKVVASYAVGDATKIDDHHHSCGSVYTPLDVGSAGGRYTPAVEEVRCEEDTPYMLVRSQLLVPQRALASAKKKVVGTLKMTVDQPTERLPINLYKYAYDKKKKKIQQMIKLRRSTKNL